MSFTIQFVFNDSVAATIESLRCVVWLMSLIDRCARSANRFAPFVDVLFDELFHRIGLQ